MSVQQGLGDILEIDYYDKGMSENIRVISEEDFSDIVSNAPDKANIELAVKRSGDGVSRINTLTS